MNTLRWLRWFLVRWYEAVLDAVFTWALYRDVKPRTPVSAGHVVLAVAAVGAFLFLVAGALSPVTLPALHLTAHAKGHALEKALEQLVDVRAREELAGR